MKDSVVRARIDGNIKKKVEEILHKLGLSTSEAINVYFNQILLNDGLPFEVKVPNEETTKAIIESRDIDNLIHSKDADEMFNKLGI